VTFLNIGQNKWLSTASATES